MPVNVWPGYVDPKPGTARLPDGTEDKHLEERFATIFRALGKSGTESTPTTTLPAAAGTSTPGADGKSAYEIAVLHGFVGTEVEWLNSLRASGSTGGILDGGTPSSTYTSAVVIDLGGVT